MFLWDSIKQHFTFPYISNSGFFFISISFHYFETHTSYQVSYMHLYRLFQFLPISSSLLWWGKEEEEAVLGVIVPGGELTKLGHGYSPAPLFPLETLWFRSLAGNPPGPCSFSISALYSFFHLLHISLSVSLRAALLLWPLAVSLVSSSAFVCGDDFHQDANANFFHCQPCTTETLHTALCLFLLCCLRAISAAVTPPFPSLNFP